jgi:hypothetical protein
MGASSDAEVMRRYVEAQRPRKRQPHSGTTRYRSFTFRAEAAHGGVATQARGASLTPTSGLNRIASGEFVDTQLTPTGWRTG